MPPENPDRIKSILEELLFKACLKCPNEDNDDGLIYTTLQEIDKEWKRKMLECVGSDKVITEEDIKSIGKEEVSMIKAMKIAQSLQRDVGYNYAKREIRKRIEEE